jgi:hypothetical protein
MSELAQVRGDTNGVIMLHLATPMSAAAWNKVLARLGWLFIKEVVIACKGNVKTWNTNAKSHMCPVADHWYTWQRNNDSERGWRNNFTWLKAHEKAQKAAAASTARTSAGNIVKVEGKAPSKAGGKRKKSGPGKGKTAKRQKTNDSDDEDAFQQEPEAQDDDASSDAESGDEDDEDAAPAITTKVQKPKGESFWKDAICVDQQLYMVHKSERQTWDAVNYSTPHIPFLPDTLHSRLLKARHTRTNTSTHTP